MDTDVKKLRQRALYLRHCAEVAERNFVPPTITEDEDEDETPKPLHVRLREAATEAIAAASALEMANDLLQYADDLNRAALDEAKKLDWYDDAYTGFCEGMAAD